MWVDMFCTVASDCYKWLLPRFPSLQIKSCLLLNVMIPCEGLSHSYSSLSERNQGWKLFSGHCDESQYYYTTCIPSGWSDFRPAPWTVLAGVPSPSLFVSCPNHSQQTERTQPENNCKTGDGRGWFESTNPVTVGAAGQIVEAKKERDLF